MIPKYQVKRILWLFILIFMFGAFWSLFSKVGDLIVYFDQGADPASALNIVPNVPLDLNVRLDWRHDDSDTGRLMESLARTEVQSAYLRAWLQWNLSLIKNEPYGLITYFVGPALADVSSEVTALAAQKWTLEQADMNHSLQLHFYSADGSIVSFTDWDATVVDILHNASGAVVAVKETSAVYQVVMFLSDGNWRVRHWVRTSDQPLEKMPPLQTPAGFVAKDSVHAQLTLNGQPYYIAGINYYPKDTAWDRFWTRSSSATIDHDFSLIHSLGLNTIRIFIPFTQFGGPYLGENADVQPTVTSGAAGKDALVTEPLNKLSDLLKQASKHQLHVVVTLFDFRSDYTLLHWPAADRQLVALLTHFRENRTILAWDLKNEPDQDYHAAGKYLVDAWLGHIASLARHFDSAHLLTIGWATPQAAQTYIPGINFVSFHYYAPAQGLVSAYAALRAATPGQPIVLGEFGLPTWNSFLFPNGHTEAEQAAYYAAILRFLRTSKSAGYLIWTLYDFSYIPSTVAGGFPWQTGPQKAMGIFYMNGKPKPVARLLAPTANLNVPLVPMWAQVVKPFWITVASSLLVICIVMGGMLLRRRRLH